MRSFAVRIIGITPLLVHRFGEAAEAGQKTRRIEAVIRDPRQEAQANAYQRPDGTFYFSAFAIPNAMGTVGGNHKATGTRKTLRFVVPSAIRMTADAITILDGNSHPATNFEVDSRPVTIPATKGRIMRHRPRWDTWSAEFDLIVNEELLDPATAHVLLQEAGLQVGIGDFRPEKRGPFGTFRVTSWDADTTATASR